MYFEMNGCEQKSKAGFVQLTCREQTMPTTVGMGLKAPASQLTPRASSQGTTLQTTDFWPDRWIQVIKDKKKMGEIMSKCIYFAQFYTVISASENDRSGKRTRFFYLQKHPAIRI